MKRMKRLSFQWRITLLTAILIAGTCICLNLLLYRSGTVSMDSLNGFVMKYDTGNSDVVKIEFDDQQMSAFLRQFSQEVYDAKAAFGKKGWCITAIVTLLSAAIAYFVSGRALKHFHSKRKISIRTILPAHVLMKIQQQNFSS